MFKHFFIPTKKNKYTPHLLHYKTIIIYIIVIVFANFVFVNSQYSKVEAGVDAGSLISLHNSQRSANGLGGLTSNSQLASSATAKAQAMLSSDCWSHYCPPGTSPWSFILNAGYNYVYAGENLAEGFSSNSSVMNAWMNSPTHRANIVNGNFKEIGIGFAYGTYQGKENNTIVVVHFGATSAPEPQPTSVPEPPPVENTEPQPESNPETQPVPESNPTTNNNTPQVIATATPKPTEIPLTLDNPKANSVISDSNPVFKGKNPINSIIEIYSNSEKLGTKIVEGPSYSFRPEKDLVEGKNSVKTKSIRDNIVLDETDEIEIYVDTAVPVIEQDSISFNVISNLSKPKIEIELETSPDVIDLKVVGLQNEYSFKKVEGSDSLWVLLINKSDVENTSDVVKVIATDNAKNTTESILDKNQILGLFEEQERLLTQPISQGGNLLLFTSFYDQFASQGTRLTFNILFILGLIILFAVDYFVLHRSGLTGKIKRSKSHLHLSIFIVLLIISIVGSIGGRIL